ncbi:efflux RND transporter periplasmic adaptor subunit [Bdellovibrio svalbardensis]|uniref:Efflux RND transporter periplasmic adaptor subunit n=1 Tax=Bdellovibrio svalbardensis TaxID=2972972 RepID=A0ABT6DIP9_9BACT|nr:efflux RND transporter periplasmic adaptor subunit [Bdellovibrio svalbardensis]MDG0816705.1 efflux RND transporter periplasmic adaptor subunit [Bdellovibrio svalbardensis]
MSKKKLLPLALVLILLVVAFLVKVFFFRSEFFYAGTIEVTKVDVPARVAAVIDEMPIMEGQIVTQGQKLVKLSCEDLKVSYSLAKINYDRARSLFRSGNISAEAYDQAANKKDDLQVRTGWCDIFSPLKGTVLTKYFEIGEMVNPGAKLFTIGDLSSVYAYFYIPHDEIAKIKVGQKTQARLHEVDNKAFEGVVEFINPEAEFTPKNVQTRDERTRLVFAVKVRFANPEEVLKPGMTLEWKGGG